MPFFHPEMNGQNEGYFLSLCRLKLCMYVGCSWIVLQNSWKMAAPLNEKRIPTFGNVKCSYYKKGFYSKILPWKSFALVNSHSYKVREECLLWVCNGLSMLWSTSSRLIYIAYFGAYSQHSGVFLSKTMHISEFGKIQIANRNLDNGQGAIW